MATTKRFQTRPTVPKLPAHFLDFSKAHSAPMRVGFGFGKRNDGQARCPVALPHPRPFIVMMSTNRIIRPLFPAVAARGLTVNWAPFDRPIRPIKPPG